MGEHHQNEPLQGHDHQEDGVGVGTHDEGQQSQHKLTFRGEMERVSETSTENHILKASSELSNQLSYLS